ncbi:MAG: hypothetical protein L6Q47_10435 [Ignavibacteriaceae bacterium]|nr:hypothetical protein [Ignavibacteriaceae bacterium]
MWFVDRYDKNIFTTIKNKNMQNSLKLIKHQLQFILKSFEWKQEQNQNNTFKFTGLSDIRDIVLQLESLQLFEGITSALKNSILFTTASNITNVQSVESATLNSQLTQLKSLVQNFYDVLNKTLPEEDVNSINIKLPEIRDFEQLSKVSKKIHLGLTQVIVNDEINGQTTIVSVENGSIWLNVFIGSVAVSVVASLIWSAAVIYKKIQEGKLLEQQVRSLKVKNDSLEDILKAQKAETELLIQAEADHISSEHFKENIPENVERIKNSIKTFAELIGEGAEIHPSLVAPENVANLFPNPTQLISIESKIKKLGGPSTN